MKTNRTAILAAISSLVSISASAAEVGQPMHPEKPTYQYEKCYGVARAGQNDCFTSKNSCGGTVNEDSAKYAWVYVPHGSCRKLTGGSLEPREG